MKTSVILSLLSLCALAGVGCADASLAKRDDGRYAVVPTNPATSAPLKSTDVHQVVPPGETGRQFAPGKDNSLTMVATETPAQRRARDDQDKLEDDLAELETK